MADKGGSFNKQGQNMQRQGGKFKKPEQNQKKEQEKWPVDEIEGER